MAPPKPIQGIWNVPSIPEPTKGRALHLLRNKKPTDSPRPTKARHGTSERPKGEKIGRSIDARALPLRYTLAVERGHMNTHEHNSHFALAARHALSDPHALTPLVLLMGFLGASLRYALEVALPAQGGFPAATLIVNIFGCFTLEIINQYVGRRTQLPAPLVKSMGIGLVGHLPPFPRSRPNASHFCKQGATRFSQHTWPRPSRQRSLRHSPGTARRARSKRIAPVRRK